ncbi:hypothetical protein JKG68_09820 [Microvirga aerilata]|uniref:Uncharacterized protein n=1 Tax=Microvirga aerilata TaxID=670292 RepID=A0A937CXL6_9HYPH|nr:hypothetical protein [Microvirga aerilata]MBL0404264.1 hypothetical protein [Microvirga aerilata]
MSRALHAVYVSDAAILGPRCTGLIRASLWSRRNENGDITGFMYDLQPGR